MILLAPGGPAARLNPRGYAGVSPASVQIAAADAAVHLRLVTTMVFATREEEIDFLRDELERAGYDESSNQKWDEATLGRVRKLKLLEEEAPRRRRADVYDDSGSDEEESDEEAEEVDEQGICWSGARGPDMEEEEAEAPTRRRCANVKEDGRQCGNPVLGSNEKSEFDPTRFCSAACAAAAAARAEALAAKMEAEALERKRARSESDVGARKPAARRAAPGLSDMMAACARAPEPEPEPEAPPSPQRKKKKKARPRRPNFDRWRTLTARAPRRRRPRRPRRPPPTRS